MVRKVDLLQITLAGLPIGEMQRVALAFVLVTMALIGFFTMRAREGHRPLLRPIAAYEALRDVVVAEAAEAGRTIHVSPGLGSVADERVVESLAGVVVLEYVAGKAAASGARLMVTVANPTLLPVAQRALRRACEQVSAAKSTASIEARFIAPGPAEYAAGVLDVLEHERVSANVMIGTFGDEYLLMGETAARQGHDQIAGTASLEALPFMYVSADKTLIGEEIFASGAYLAPTPSRLGSLLAQDWMRGLIILGILVGVVLNSLH
jgi:hypothetical protein